MRKRRRKLRMLNLRRSNSCNVLLEKLFGITGSFFAAREVSNNKKNNCFLRRSTSSNEGNVGCVCTNIIKSALFFFHFPDHSKCW